MHGATSRMESYRVLKALLLFLIATQLPSFQDAAALRHEGLQEKQGGDTVTDEPGTCTEVQSEEQATAFRAFFESERLAVGKRVYIGCASLAKLGPLLTELWNPEIHPVTVVNIGANKGYNLVEWLDWWSPEAGKGTSEWRNKMVEKFGIHNFTQWKLCGACWNCEQETKSTASKVSGRDTAKVPPGLKIHAIEPSRSNFELLKDLQSWVGHSGLEVFHMAVSNFVGVALFPITQIGFPRAALSQETLEAENVTVLTLDAYMDIQGMDRINYLFIDTEGHDPLVLEGAVKALSDNRIDLVQFEYHHIGWWQRVSLKSVVDELDRCNYDCFLLIPRGEGRDDGTVQLTGCWHNSYEFRNWSNVLCSLRKNRKIIDLLRGSCVFLKN